VGTRVGPPLPAEKRKRKAHRKGAPAIEKKKREKKSFAKSKERGREKNGAKGPETPTRTGEAERGEKQECVYRKLWGEDMQTFKLEGGLNGKNGR